MRTHSPHPLCSMKLALLTTAISTLAWAVPARADVTGQPLPESEVEDFAQTGAESLEDLTGRLVLIEFFAYW